MLYTFTIRSKDRVFGDTSDYRITLPYNAELARADYWSIRVARVVIPRTDYYAFWYETTVMPTIPDDDLVSTSEYLQMHLDFGTPCHGYDTELKGAGTVQHIITNAKDLSETNADPLFESRPADAVEYRIVRPNLSELRVQLFDKFGRPAKGMKRADFPTFVADQNTTLLSVETDLPDWLFVIHIEATEKNVSQY